MINRKNLAEQVAEKLADEIVSGTLAGGARIGEQAWADRLGVGRSSIREALIMLKRHHLVELTPGRGARVAPLDQAWLGEVYALWYLLFEAAAAALVARAEHIDLMPLTGQAEQLRTLAQRDQREAFFDLALSMATSLAELAGRPLLMEHLLTLLPAAKRCYRVVVWSDQAELERTLALVDALLVAAAKSDRDAVHRAVREYALEQRRALDRALEAQTAVRT